jgi:homoserine dehydrogenase
VRIVRFVIVGLGNLGRRFCEIIAEKEEDLQARYQLSLVMVGAADSRGAAYDPRGLDPERVAKIKLEGGSVGAYPGAGQPEWDSLQLVHYAEADLLLEASPVHLEQGAEPGLSCIRAAMQKGMNIATPNKGPLVVAFDELHTLAEAMGVELRYDGTVAGGLPALYTGMRDMRGGDVIGIEAIPNLSTGYVMDLIAEGMSWDEATAYAFEAGVLEGDGSWDLDGWDAAAKLLILARAVLGYSASLDDVKRTGVRQIEPEKLIAAQAEGRRYRLLAEAERCGDGDYDLRVVPTPMPADHPLGRMGQKQMGVIYETDIYGTVTMIIDEPTPVPSAATMLRDLIDIYIDA